MTDRVIVYSGAIPLESDVLRTNKFAMMAVAKLAAAMLGTSTVVNGLACVPTGPAGLTVNVNPGEIYSLVNVDSTAYSSVPADTTHSILKQGVLLDTLNLSCPPPGTGGQSINYLIQATYQDSDTDNVALPYYNASNPTQAWSGPGNTGTAQSTTRKGIITINAKAGTAATTGSQTTPAADSGFTGLWVVTVANGQTQITAANIAQATNAPILPADLLHAVQASSLITGTDTGAANACVVNYSYPVTALTDGMVLWFKAKAANTGATTLNVNGLGAQPVVGGNNSALQGGELVANGKAQVVWNATISSFVLLECTGAAVQVAPATQSQHAMQLGQATGRLLRVSVFANNGGTQQVSVNGGAFTTTGASTFIPHPLATQWDVEGCGAGGGSGGTAATTASQVAFVGGAGSASYARSFYTSMPASVAITCGAPGSAATAGNNGGGNGGSSGFGALLTAPGGLGSNGSSAVPTGAASMNAGAGAATSASGGNILNTVGIGGSFGFYIDFTKGPFGGSGASTPLGQGGQWSTTINNGTNGSGYGSGAGGPAAQPSSAAGTGKAGAGGAWIVREYA